MDAQVPRLIIQPLVENCMKYGNNCQPPWKISIIGECTDQKWEIHISDNGPGFTDEALEKIREKIRQSEEHPGIPDVEIHGMGLLNVYLRWKLAYQERMIFRCENLPEGGSCVTLGFASDPAAERR
jgi:two-component system sensor histidine kinase YesM